MEGIFEKKANEANELIDQGRYDEAVKIIQNIVDTRIHDLSVLKTLRDHFEKVEKKYADELSKIENISGNPLEIYEEAADKIFKISEWRAKEYLRFFDQVRRENDL